MKLLYVSGQYLSTPESEGMQSLQTDLCFSLPPPLETGDGIRLNHRKVS